VLLPALALVVEPPAFAVDAQRSPLHGDVRD
jgi:hypothetical protein